MLKEIYRGIVLRNQHGIFINRTIIIALYKKEEVSILTEVTNSYHPISSIITNKYYNVSQINNPTLGIVIALSLEEPEMQSGDREFLKEALRVALFNGLMNLSRPLSLEPINDNENFWINQRLLQMYKDACDNIDYELSN